MSGENNPLGDDSMRVLFESSSIEEIRYFVEELEAQGIKCLFNKEHIPVSNYPAEIGTVRIWVSNEDYERALAAYGKLTGYEMSEGEEISVSNEEWNEFVEFNKKQQKKIRLYYWIPIGLFFGVILLIIIWAIFFGTVG